MQVFVMFQNFQSLKKYEVMGVNLEISRMELTKDYMTRLISDKYKNLVNCSITKFEFTFR